MDASTADFRRLVQAVIARFYAQNAQSVPAASILEEFSRRLAEVVTERGLPSPLPAGDPGVPGGLPETEINALVTRLMPSGADEFLTDVARQLVKACFYPEFTVCRDSYRERGKDGACRRQEGDRARRRVSGTHCVDCPHWVALEDASHEAFLAAAWHGGPEQFRANRDIFLPEDFREFRRWLWRRERGSA